MRSRIVVFANRNSKEILRDPLSLFFGIAFPVILMLLLTTINQNIPADLFDLTTLTPGIAVFSLSFIALFAAQILAKDRESAFLSRLLTTPMTANDFVLGYTIPLVLISIAQSIACYIIAVILGLEIAVSFIVAITLLIPTSLLFISIGIISGTLLTEKAAVGICGGILTNLSAWLSGIWFDLNLVGGLFKDIAYALPFVHAVEMGKAALAANYSNILPHLWWVLGYGLPLFAIAIFCFHKNIKRS